MFEEITDTETLNQLNGKSKPATQSIEGFEEITDPETLGQLNVSSESEGETEKPYSPPGASGILSDLLKSVEQAPMDIWDIVKSIPGEAQGIGKQVMNDPARIPKNLLAGAGNLAKGTYNLLLDPTIYLGKKGIPGYKQLAGLAEKLRIGDTGLQKKLLGDEQPGDQLTQSLAQIFNPALRAGRGASGLKALGERAAGGAVAAQEVGGNPVAGALLNVTPEAVKSGSNKGKAVLKDIKETPKMAEAVNKAAEEAGISEEQLTSFKKELEVKHGAKSPEALQRQINTSKEEAVKLKPAAMREAEQIEGMLPPARGENLIPKAKSAQSALVQELQDYQGDGQTHDVDLARGIKKEFESRKKEVGKSYNELQASLKGKSIKPGSQQSSKELMAELREILKKGDNRSPEATEIAAKLNNIGKSENIPADEFLASYRSVRKLAQDARYSATERGITRDEAKARTAEADTLKKKENQMMYTLENGLDVGKDVVEKLKDTNHKYSTEIGPVFDNSIYRGIHNNGRIEGANIMNKLRGDEAGHNVLNDIISKDPALLRSLIGHTYSKKPQGLIDASDHEKGYINQLPALQSLVSQLNKSNKDVKKATVKTKNMNVDADRIEKSFDEIKKQELERRKAYEELVKLKNKVNDRQKSLNELNKRLKNEALSKAEEARLRQEFKDHTASLDKIKKVLFDLSKVGIVAGGAGQILKIMSGLI